MSLQRVHLSRSQSSQTSVTSSQLAPRPFSVQQPKSPQTQEDIENEAFDQHKFEAFGLQLKETKGTITPVEQERLGMLQAKMDSFWAQRKEQVNARPSFLHRVRLAPAPQAMAPATPFRLPPLAMGQPGGATSMATAAPVQPKLTIGQPNDQYEQEADRMADQVMSMPDTATQQPVQRQASPEEEEVQTKPLAASITPLVQL